MGTSRDLSALDNDIQQATLRLIRQAFKYGIECDIIQGELKAGGDEQGVREVSTTQNYVLGTRRVTPDGRVFHYAKAGANCFAGQGCTFYNQVAVSYTTLAAAQSIGDTTIQIASQTFTLNQLEGGYVVIYGADNSDVQQRRITGNTAASASTVTITLEEALTVAVTVSTGVEVLHNPWSDLRTLDGADLYYNSIAGVAAEEADTGEYFWCQTWGPIWIAPGEAGLGGAESGAERQVIFNAGGALRAHILNVTSQSRQHAGFIINRDSSGSDGPPFIMLQICP